MQTEFQSTIDRESCLYLEQGISQYIQRDNPDSSETYESYPGTDAVHYDFAGERQRLSTRTTNIVESIAHLVKGCLGAGILGMHEAYMRGGIWTSLTAAGVIAIIVPYSMFMIVRSAQKMYVRLRVPRLSYPDLAEAAMATSPFGCCRRYCKHFRYTVELCLFAEQCGSCCIYGIIIALTIKQAAEACSTTVKEWQLPLKMYILTISLPLLLICLIRSLKYLAPLSLIADAYVGVSILITLFYSIKAEKSLSDKGARKSDGGLFRFLGVCIFSVNNVSIVLPIENNMTTPKYFRIVLQYGMTIVFICVTAVGTLGYWAWGEQCRTPITLHLPLDTTYIVLQFLLSIMLCVTFALSFWVPFQVLWHHIRRYHNRNISPNLWERVYRALHVTLIVGLAIAFSNVQNFMAFLGDFLLAWNGFIFPAFIESLVTWREHRPAQGKIRWMVVKNCCIIIFGLALNVGAFYNLSVG